MRILIVALSIAVAACSSAEASDGSGDDTPDEAEGALKSTAEPVYLGQAPLTGDSSTLYDKLTVIPSIVSRGAKVTGPSLFGIVCTREPGEPCMLNWVQRSDLAPTAFFVGGDVAKAIFLALPAADRPEADRTFGDAAVGASFYCSVQKGGILSSDIYSCAFSGLTATLQRVSGSVKITANAELKEADARAAADKLFPKL